MKLYDVSWKHLREVSVILGFIFKYLVCQVSFINKCILLMQKYSEYIDQRIWMVIQFLITVFAVVFMNFSGVIFNMLMGGGFITRGLSIAYMFVFAIYTFVTQNKYMQVFQFSSILYTIITMIVFILRIIFSIIVVFVAVTIIGIYLFLY